MTNCYVEARSTNARSKKKIVTDHRKARMEKDSLFSSPPPSLLLSDIT